MEHVWFSGNYSTWAEARAVSAGYDAPEILSRVLEATRAVISGKAACERDSVALQTIEYSLPLLASLLYVASRCAGKLNVMDYGGSLGSSYWQNRKLLNHLSVKWSIVEQPDFVRIGLSEIATDVLRFYSSIEACLAHEQPNVVILSSVLPYLERPFEVMRSLFAASVDFIVVDRTPFFVHDLPDRITVEYVPPSIYNASYPAWFFNLPTFRRRIADFGYHIVEEFDSWEKWNVEESPAQSKCLLLESGRSCQHRTTRGSK